MMHEARLVRLDAGKVHLGATLYAVHDPVQTFGLALAIRHF